VQPYVFNKDDSKLHQFIFFLKPEVTATYDNVKLDLILKDVLQKLEDAKVKLGAVRVLGGEYLDSKNIMGQHYGVISNISRNGTSAITEGAVSKLNEVFGAEIKKGGKVVGGHQLISELKGDLNAYALRVLNDNLGTTRLAGGTYAMKLQVLGTQYIVLNPFHPYQLVPYVTPGHGIIVFEGLSSVSWADLRNLVCGVTDPTAAAKGSVRQTLLEKQTTYGLADVNKSTNGCHMSAGPVEALVELKRFFDVTDNSQTHFGHQLITSGVTTEKVDWLNSNPDLTFGDKTQSVFDGTEELNSEAAASKLVSALPK